MIEKGGREEKGDSWRQQLGDFCARAIPIKQNLEPNSNSKSKPKR